MKRRTKTSDPGKFVLQIFAIVIKEKTEEVIRECQSGFGKNRSINDPIFAISTSNE